jgi:SAM-dependent methyltransferase
MENLEEVHRLEIKTDPEEVRKQALWCGLRPGLRVLDAGCGPGKITSILHEMIQPGGSILGVDYSEERIHHAEKQYSQKTGIEFQVHDLREPLVGMGEFDLIWARFMLEYNLKESLDIVQNLADGINPGGYLCLLDLDQNCLSYYEMPSQMESIIFKIIKKLEREFNFDPYVGRKLYASLYDLGFEDIEVDLTAHHLIYGKAKDEDAYNWLKKMEVISKKTKALFKNYPRNYVGFEKDFTEYFNNHRRFIYTPMILCKGRKPPSS